MGVWNSVRELVSNPTVPSVSAPRVSLSAPYQLKTIQQDLRLPKTGSNSNTPPSMSSATGFLRNYGAERYSFNVAAGKRQDNALPYLRQMAAWRLSQYNRAAQAQRDSAKPVVLQRGILTIQQPEYLRGTILSGKNP